MRCPYTMYKEKAKRSLVWYAWFWDEKSQRYAISRSLGVLAESKKGRREAEEKARLMVPIAQKDIEAAYAPVKKNGELPLIP